MKKNFCLDFEGGIYSLGDLNVMLQNKDTIIYPETDAAEPATPFFTGKIAQTVTVADTERPFLLYIPEHFPISGAGLFLCPDSGVTAEECLLGGWQALSEETDTALIIMQARETGWSREDIQGEVTYCEAVFKKAISRVYFSMNEATYYIAGLGEGAYIAAAYGLLNSSVWCKWP